MTDIKMCSVDGCNEVVVAKSFCRHHYYSFKKYGDPLQAQFFATAVLDLTKATVDWATAHRYQRKNGYAILYKTINSKRYTKLEHVFVWETINGAKPEGFCVHHIDGTKDNNSIENLILMTHKTHRRIHKGQQEIDSKWWKFCSICEILKPVDNEHFYRTGQEHTSICRDCQKIKNKEYGLSHKQEISDQKKEYGASHKEQRALYAKLHRDEINARCRKNSALHRDDVNERKREERRARVLKKKGEQF